MRALQRNKQPIWYDVLEAVEPIRVVDDGEELETGEFAYKYSEPAFLLANVSAGTGSMSTSVFGQYTDYTRTIALTGTECPLMEGARVWVEIKTDEPPNYVVVKVAKSLNGWMIALKELSGNA